MNNNTSARKDKINHIAKIWKRTSAVAAAATTTTREEFPLVFASLSKGECEIRCVSLIKTMIEHTIESLVDASKQTRRSSSLALCLFLNHWQIGRLPTGNGLGSIAACLDSIADHLTAGVGVGFAITLPGNVY